MNEVSPSIELGMRMKKIYSKPTLVKERKLTSITAVSSKGAPPPP